MPSAATATTDFFTLSLNTVMIVLINTLLWGGVIYLLILLIRALRKYLRPAVPTAEKSDVPVSLPEVLKAQRLRHNMTQEFVADRLNVSRQAVSRWENGTAQPSTANLLALAQLYEVAPEKLLHFTQT